MIVQFNTGHNIDGNEAMRTPLIALITQELKRYSDRITRVEAHLTDEDGEKNGGNDKRCVLEARLEGRQPIAVTHYANSYYLAVEGATDKLMKSLQTIVDSSMDH